MKPPNGELPQLGVTGRLISRHTFSLTIVLVLCLGLSAASWFGIPVEVMPRENTPAFLAVRVEALEPGTPERMELTLTLPLEGVAKSQPNLLRFSSSTSGRSVSLSLTYKPRTDLDMAEFMLTEALQDLESQGLIDMRKVSISRMNPDATAIAKLAVSYDSSVADPNKTIKEELRIGLESISEISKVEVSGLQPPQISYDIPLARISELGLQGHGLAEFMNAQAVREPVGTAGFGSESFVTAVNARVAALDFERLQGQRIRKGSTITLRDIASEKLVASGEISRKNGSDSVFVEIFAKEGANLFDLNRHLSEYLAKLERQNDDLGKLRFETIFNRTDDLKSAIADVFGSLYEAIFITFLVVFAFLRRWRSTVLISLTIPGTLLLTILVLYVKGVSLNILTLSGLILGIGMVVDSAILIVDSIAELRAKGLSRLAAAAKGAQDSTAALAMSTLTNAAIFLPIAFIEGGDSFTDILKAFQLPIVASLGASFFVALLFLPVATVFWKDKTTAGSVPQEAASPRALAVFRWLQARRMPVLLSAAAIIITTFQLVKDIRETDLEMPRDPFSTISVKFGAEVANREKRQIFETIEKALLQKQSEFAFRFVISDFNPNFVSGNFMIYPRTSEDSDRTINELEEQLKLFVHHLRLDPGVQVSLGWSSIGATGAVRRYDTFKFSGPKLAKLVEVNSRLKAEIAKVPGVELVRLEKEETGERSFVFLPSEAVMLSYGLNLSQIAAEISTAMSSALINNLNLNGKTIGAKISFAPSGRGWDMDALKNLRIRTRQNQSVTLSELGRLRPMMSTPSISRQAGLASSRVFVYYGQALNDRAYAEARYAVSNLTRSFSFPPGYGQPQNDSLARIAEMAEKSDFIIYLSGLLIYLLLAAMFESVLLPFAIMFTVPLALLFGVAGLKLVGMDLDVMARLSLIILVGIGVNGAIILIDLITNLRAEGQRRAEAVVQGCARRLRAVSMTTAIQIISVLPVALGKAKIMGIPYSSLGVAIISGMLLSTVGTLVLLPMTYEWLDDVEQALKARLGIVSPDAKTEGSSLNESTADQLRAA